MQSPRSTNNINVFVRARPLTHAQAHTSTIYYANEKQILLYPSPQQISQNEKAWFTFDRVFTEDASQNFEKYHRNIFEGINGTILCYGQTSSGKTYTCIGSSFEEEHERGILPRVINDMLKKMQANPKYIECTMPMSIIQIYNEKIRDLLDKSKNNLKIRCNKSQGIFIDGITQKYILQIANSERYFSKSKGNRVVASTNMNQQSSRSHMIITLTVHQHNLYTGRLKGPHQSQQIQQVVKKYPRVDLQGNYYNKLKKQI